MRKQDDERLADAVRRDTAEVNHRLLEEAGRGIDFLRSDSAKSGDPLGVVGWPKLPVMTDTPHMTADGGLRGLLRWLRRIWNKISGR